MTDSDPVAPRTLVESDIDAPERRFAIISSRYEDDPEVGIGTGFGSSPGLRVSGRIFAMLIHDELVVKIDRGRVDELVASGAGRRFDPGHGRIMKEWVAVSMRSQADWARLADEARAFVGQASSWHRTGRP